MAAPVTAGTGNAASPVKAPVMVAEWDRREAIGRQQRRRMAVAGAVSLAFHVSMITLFEIVLVFPREDAQFFEVSIVSSPATPETAVAHASEARMGDQLALSGPRLFDGDLPAVDLPVIEFAELERLRIRFDAAEPLPEMERLLDASRPADSWARFGEEVQRLGRTLREMAMPGDDAPGPAAKRYLPHRPAEGFEAYIEWSGPPYERELLFAPPVRALWNVGSGNMRRPVEIVFKVDAGGRVVNVWSPVIDDDGLLDDIQMTVLQYRFAPLAGYMDEATTAPVEQSGVLFIRAIKGAS